MKGKAMDIEKEVADYRSKYPDLTEAEEKAIRDFHSGKSNCLFFRNNIRGNMEGYGLHLPPLSENELAQVILTALEAENGPNPEFPEDQLVAGEIEHVLIDGTFDLRKVARAVIEAQREAAKTLNPANT